MIELHSCGSFDYPFVMRKIKAGIEIRNRILTFHLEGLLNIIKEIEIGSIPQSESEESLEIVKRIGNDFNEELSKGKYQEFFTTY